MIQTGTPLLALFNPRFARFSVGRSIRCLPDKSMRRSFDSDRSAGSLVIWLRSITNFGCDYLIQPVCNVPHRILYDSVLICTANDLINGVAKGA
jgi:hypothetical protein